MALAGFLGLTGIALDRAFRNSAESSVREYLRSQVYGLLAAAELTPTDSLTLPQSPEPRLSRTNSGLFAWVWDAAGNKVWKSPSAFGTEIRPRTPPQPGDFSFRRDSTETGQPIFVFSYAVVWETGDGKELPFVFSVAEDYTLYQSRVNEFRRTLWTWLLGSIVVLVIVQLAALVWILRPLRNIASEVTSIEHGQRDRLSTDYPEELRSLALNLNALLTNERTHRQRYRDKLDDLAHSLKTPLAVMRNLVDKRAGGAEANPEWDAMEEVAAQVERMQGIVSYQLRSAAGGRSQFSLAHPVKPEIDKLARSLAKAYQERGIDIEIEVSDQARFRGDVGDFVEIVGNLMDNACKHCRHQVAVTVKQDAENNNLIVRVDDDGPGIPVSSRKEYLGRRIRGDTHTEGQGIGLAVVDNIVAEYGGTFEIGEATLGGARVEVRLPGAVGQ